jgi:hypothetical protein
MPNGREGPSAQRYFRAFRIGASSGLGRGHRGDNSLHNHLLRGLHVLYGRFL